MKHCKSYKNLRALYHNVFLIFFVLLRNEGGKKGLRSLPSLPFVVVVALSPMFFIWLALFAYHLTARLRIKYSAASMKWICTSLVFSGSIDWIFVCWCVQCCQASWLDIMEERKSHFSEFASLIFVISLSPAATCSLCLHKWWFFEKMVMMNIWCWLVSSQQTFIFSTSPLHRLRSLIDSLRSTFCCPQTVVVGASLDNAFPINFFILFFIRLAGRARKGKKWKNTELTHRCYWASCRLAGKRPARPRERDKLSEIKLLEYISHNWMKNYQGELKANEAGKRRDKRWIVAFTWALGVERANEISVHYGFIVLCGDVYKLNHIEATFWTYSRSRLPSFPTTNLFRLCEANNGTARYLQPSGIPSLRFSRLNAVE